MKPIAFMLFMALAFSLPAKVPLSQAVKDAWALSGALDGQKLQERAAALARESALRQKYFSAAFVAGYRASTDKVEVTAGTFPFPLGPNVPAGTVILSAPSQSVDLKLSLQQPLYAGGALSQAVRIEAGRELSERELTRLKRVEIAGIVKASYFNHLLYSRKRDSLNSLLASLEIHLRKLKDLFAEDLVRRSALLETQAKADEARLGLEDVEQLIEAEAVRFRSLCGHDPGDIEPQALDRRESFAAARESFRTGHPLLRSLDEKAGMLRAQKKAVAGAYLPQVGAFAELHYGRPGQNFFSDRWTLYAAGGVNVSLPVFNWNRRGRDLELADIALRQLEDRRADFVRESERSLSQLFLQRDSLERKRALLDRLEANAREDVGLKENLYAESQIAHSDLLAAMTSQERYRAERGGLEAQLGLLATSIDTLIGVCQEEE